MRADRTVETDDGVLLGLKHTPAVGERRGTVLLLHAMMVDARTLDRPEGNGLASTLADAGWSVWRADFRGRGMSDRPPDWTYDDLVQHDLPALVSAMPERPFVVTHSLGGHVTTAAWSTGRVTIRGLAGLASAPWMSSLEPSRRLRAKKHAAMGFLSTCTRLAGRMPARRLRFGSVDESAGYVADLARFWRSGRWASRAGEDWGAAMRDLRGPFLQVTSDGDRLLGHPDASIRWAKRVPTAHCVRLCTGDFGIDHPPDHMELGRAARMQPVWRWMSSWMAEQV